QETIGPVGGAALGKIDFRQHDEGWQVFVDGAEAVGDPGADGRVAAELVTGVEMVKGGGMVDAFGLGAAIDAEVTPALGEVTEVFADVHARLAGFAEFEGALDEVALP